MKVNWCKRKKTIVKSQNEFNMHKKFLTILLTISSSLIAMEEIVATHPLIAAAAANNILKISDELDQLKKMGATALYNLLECKNTQVALALQKSECLTFEKITYAALAQAIKNKKAQAAQQLLYAAPVCLHNNPGYLLHEAAHGSWNWELTANQKEVLKLMIENGALADQKHPITGKTPADVAQETNADYEVCLFLKGAAQKQQKYTEDFKPYHREVRIPPYFDIVSYESAQTLHDERRFDHYKQHSRVDYKPT